MISPLASIHPNAKLGNNVIIEPFAVIHENVTIGDSTHIMSHVLFHLPFTFCHTVFYWPHFAVHWYNLVEQIFNPGLFHFIHGIDPFCFGNIFYTY